MKLQNLNILLISPEPWTHLFVSKHHYATHLAARGNRVFFLNPPSRRFAIEKTAYENVYSVSYGGFIKGLRFMPAFVQRYLIRRKFSEIQHLCGVVFDVVWAFDNSVFFDFSALPDQVFCISHIVDLNQHFQFEKAAKTADICIGVIPSIVSKFKALNQNSHLIGHGVQVFSKTHQKIELPGQNPIKAMYMGNLQMPHIDWSALLALVCQFDTVDFVFVGSDNHRNDSAAKEEVFSKKNVIYVKPIVANQVPDFLHIADVLLLAYTHQYFQEYASPHKMKEYLASGKMILSCEIPEYQGMKDKGEILMASDASTFCMHMKTIIANIDIWNSEEMIKKRKESVFNQTYDMQIEKIEDLICTNNLIL